MKINAHKRLQAATEVVANIGNDVKSVLMSLRDEDASFKVGEVDEDSVVGIFKHQDGMPGIYLDAARVQKLMTLFKKYPNSGLYLTGDKGRVEFEWDLEA